MHVHRQPTQVVHLRAQAINVLIINPFEQELQQVEKREEYKVLPPHSTRDQVLPTVQHIPGIAAIRAGPGRSIVIGVATVSAGCRGEGEEERGGGENMTVMSSHTFTAYIRTPVTSAAVTHMWGSQDNIHQEQ